MMKAVILSPTYLTPSNARKFAESVRDKNKELGDAVKEEPFQIAITALSLVALAFMVFDSTILGFAIGSIISVTLLGSAAVLVFGIVSHWKELQKSMNTEALESMGSLAELGKTWSERAALLEAGTKMMTKK